jgi:DNA-nicking Smr family endonuclease
LDLHDLTKKETIEMLNEKLIKSTQKKKYTIITGRGNHEFLRVLKPTVEEYLVQKKIKFNQDYGEFTFYL